MRYINIRFTYLLTYLMNIGATKYRTGPHRTSPDRQKLGEGSPQPGKTMGSHGTLPLWVGIRNSALTPIYKGEGTWATHSLTRLGRPLRKFVGVRCGSFLGFGGPVR